MPCEVFSPRERLEESHLTINKLSGWLCALLRHKDVTVDLIREACHDSGLQPERLMNWWLDHQAADAVKKDEEERQRQISEIKKRAWSKLASEERRALMAR